jgi:hypothetical protein
MFWEALGRAGWVGEIVSVRTIVALHIRVGRAPLDAAGMRRGFERCPVAREPALRRAG